MASTLSLLAEIAAKLRKLECICANTGAASNTIVQNYQPLDCNGDPVGSPIDVMATISVAKQDVAICNTDAIVGTYNVPHIYQIPPSTESNIITDLGLDVTKLHSISFSVIAGTVDIGGDLGGGIQSATGLPVGFFTSFDASTTFNTGSFGFTTDASGIVILTTMSSL